MSYISYVIMYLSFIGTCLLLMRAFGFNGISAFITAGAIFYCACKIYRSKP